MSHHQFTMATKLLAALCIWCTLLPFYCDAVAFDIHELEHDTPLVESKRIQLEATKGEHVKFQVPTNENSNNTLRLFLSKPPKVREKELDNLKSGIGHWSLVDVKENPPFLIWPNLNAKHRGNYSLYKFEFDANNRLVDSSRIDINLVVHGLRESDRSCFKDEDCSSDNCCLSDRCKFLGKFGKCVCSENQYLDNNRQCSQAKNLNESCQIDFECRLLAGPQAECFSSWGNKCRCNRDSVPIKISESHRSCVSLAQLHRECLYSMQCSLAGDNRYCDANYQCQCLPGYRLEQGRYCSSASSLLKANVFQLLLAIILTFILLSQ